jgi:hypothetical protein
LFSYINKSPRRQFISHVEVVCPERAIDRLGPGAIQGRYIKKCAKAVTVSRCNHNIDHVSPRTSCVADISGNGRPIFQQPSSLSYTSSRARLVLHVPDLTGKRLDLLNLARDRRGVELMNGPGIGGFLQAQCTSGPRLRNGTFGTENSLA